MANFHLSTDNQCTKIYLPSWLSYVYESGIAFPHPCMHNVIFHSITERCYQICLEEVILLFEKSKVLYVKLVSE